MDTEKKYGLKKDKALLLFFQMLLIIVVLITSAYLLIFVSMNNLGGWMISSYVFILLSVLAITAYATIGYKKKDFVYLLAVSPFAIAVFINILLPQRNTIQIALLSLLFASVIAFLLKQNDKKVNVIISILMVVVALAFSIYSSITARLDFLGQMDAKWYTYLAMYLSIFIPTIMSGTFALTYNVRMSRTND